VTHIDQGDGHEHEHVHQEHGEDGPAHMHLMLPNTIRVLGQRYELEVIEDSGLPLDPYDPASYAAIGMTDTDALKIKLRGPDGMAEDTARAVLLHEVLHAIIGTVGIPIDREDEEQLVKMLAPALLHTLRDNPELVAALLSR
jgi:hypothetical protein